jgi:hypothetical protein
MVDQGLQLGISKDILVLHQHQQITETLVDMISQSRLNIRILSHDLEPHIYSSSLVCQTLASVISQNRRARVEVLIQDIDVVVKADHGLIKLMRHLSSYVEIRKTAPEHSQCDQAFTLIDDCGYLQRSLDDSRELEICYNSRRKVRNLASEFKGMWEHSLRATELLRLYL